MMTGVLLAAGGSTRMGSPKALARRGPETFVARGIRNLWAACDSVVVVLGSNAAAIRRRTEEEFMRMVESGRLSQDLLAARHARANDLEVEFLTHPGWKRGMYSSVRVGLAAALAGKPEAVVVLPVDHPDVRPGTVADLATLMHQAIAASRSPKVRAAFSYAVVPRLRGDRGHPVVLSAALAKAIAADGGAEHLSDAVRRSARLVGYLDVKDKGVVRNRNTPRD